MLLSQPVQSTDGAHRISNTNDDEVTDDEEKESKVLQIIWNPFNPDLLATYKRVRQNIGSTSMKLYFLDHHY